MGWVRIVFGVVVTAGTIASVWVLRDHVGRGATALVLGSIVAAAIVSVLWVAVSGTMSDKAASWRRRWCSLASHPLAVSLATLGVIVTVWFAIRMLDGFPVAAVVFLAVVAGVLSSLADRRTPAIAVIVIGVYGLVSVVGLGASAREPVAVETAIVVGTMLLAVSVVALLVSGARFRWPMVMVGSLSAGYVWSGFAVLQFAPLSVPFKRVGIAGLLGAAVAALLLGFVARSLDGDFGEVSGSEG
jgi:hypothetical protein